MEIFIFWILFSFAVILLANRFDRSGVGWFLISLVVSPLIAAIFLVIIGHAGKKCPSCAETVKKEATICRHCGYELSS